MNLPSTVSQQPPTTREDDPEAQLEWASRAARALMTRVEQKKRKVVIGGKQYLEFGDWQTLASFFSATVGTDWSRVIMRDGEIVGYEARAVVYRNGQVISSAEAACFRREKNWSNRDEFALRSMAQTRACAKALRNAFGWVAELAGYASTPAEEVGDMEPIDPHPPRRSYNRKLPVDNPAAPTPAASATPAATDKVPGGAQSPSTAGDAFARAQEDHDRVTDEIVQPLTDVIKKIDTEIGQVGTRENLFYMARQAAKKGGEFFKKSFYRMRTAAEQEQMLEIGLELRQLMDKADKKREDELGDFK